jgi:hypothetical protein
MDAALRIHVLKFLFHNAEIFSAVYFGMSDSRTCQDAREPLSHGELSLDLLLVDSPPTHEQGKGKFIERREGEQGIDHVPDS